ncbi:long-chain-alcohol O-fatty-acyltransferase-like [Rutidosis leptorrhynchoides]|uniref:long-chain-alcohol O-fatty-acyltransferase-like n=1 Tax=Rutidosis leptorrhynchoides TaxID=125765 RepID=UPI003A994D76
MEEDYYYEDLKTFIKIWLIAISCICYCYLISSRISNVFPRLLSIIPVIILFFILPLHLSTFNLTGLTFIYIAWLANFKLVLFAFNQGPLASTPRLPFKVFVAVALFPIIPKQKFTSNNKKSVSAPAPTSVPVPSHKPVLLALKAIILAIIVTSYPYKDKYFNSDAIKVLYYCHLYLGLELFYATTVLIVKMIFLGFNFEIEPQFNEPYLATSLQDYWGRRWNLMATNVLRPTVYNPLRNIFTPIFGTFWSKIPAIFVTFVVSGLMHELMYFYFTRELPTWEVTWFFVLHGVCTFVEVIVKKFINRRLWLPWVVSGPITLAFVVVTSDRLLFPQLIRNGIDVKVVDEYLAFVNYILGPKRE